MDCLRNINNKKPDSEDSKQFWSDIWANEKEHERHAEWLRELRAEKHNIKQSDINITEMITKQIKKKKKKKNELEKLRTRWSSGSLAEEINSIT